MPKFDHIYQRRAFIPKKEPYFSGSFGWSSVCDYPHHYFKIDDDEFWRLYDSGVIGDWNDRHGTMLDEFEEGIYEDRLDTMLKEVIDSIGEGTISNAISTAIDEGTGVCFFFSKRNA